MLPDKRKVEDMEQFDVSTVVALYNGASTELKVAVSALLCCNQLPYVLSTMSSATLSGLKAADFSGKLMFRVTVDVLPEMMGVILESMYHEEPLRSTLLATLAAFLSNIRADDARSVFEATMNLLTDKKNETTH